MKQNLNEQMSRIKSMMGLNEEVVNLSTYKDESKIVDDIKLVGMSEDNNPLISMILHTFIPNKDSNTEGQMIKLTVITKWGINVVNKMKQYVVKEIVDVKSDVELDNSMIIPQLKMIIGSETAVGLMNNLYRGYVQLHSSDKEYLEKIYNNRTKDLNDLKNLLPEIEDPFFKKTKQPTEKVKQSVDNNTPEKPKNPSIWTSTSSWASE